LNWLWWYSRDRGMHKLRIYSTQVVFSYIYEKFHVINIFFHWCFLFLSLFSLIDFMLFFSTRSKCWTKNWFMEYHHNCDWMEIINDVLYFYFLFVVLCFIIFYDNIQQVWFLWLNMSKNVRINDEMILYFLKGNNHDLFILYQYFINIFLLFY